MGLSSCAPQPELVCNLADFVLHLDRLRRRAARGTSSQRVGLDALARRTQLPRSTVHAYLTGVSLPPSDRLDVLVSALGCTPSEVHEWAQARDRVADEKELRRWQPVDDISRLPSEHAQVRSRRAQGLDHCVDLAEWANQPSYHPSAGSEVVPTVIHAAVVATWTGTYIYRDPAADAPRTGFLHAGNNWVICQAVGGKNPMLGTQTTSRLWLYTQADVAHDQHGGWGWLPATAMAHFNPQRPLHGIPWIRSELTRSPGDRLL